MADWFGTARSNHFRVKDLKAFQTFCDKWELGIIIKGNLVGFVCDTCFGELPDRYADVDEVEADGEENDGDDQEGFLIELSTHLLDNEVAVMMESGAEAMCYITGRAIAINSKGETASVDIVEIYDKAKTLGSNVDVR